ncbi:cytochrome c oxidase assembly protein [Actinocrinis puniceicyclus]|uniref:Cytochrome c oxidase assembly protein n=1 Tax=Actinocrinis puniceicyclus TaxID=977794 RepID=A0A8J8BDJ4_9ACTN|nr:cytochrome c oxidase assembly protein [Actinocrinis puniceicyclus]MBS2964221.1 cytochrome c oxidase assembly protein [Actinocrinis puniceicyclus]
MTTGLPGAGPHTLFSAYSGPPNLQNSAYLTQWTLNPWVLAVVVVSGALYLAGVKRVKARGSRWERSRTVLFFGGLGLFAFVCMSFLGSYERILFWPRAVQNTLLMMVVPMLLALGSPLSLMMENCSEGGRLRIERVLRSRPAYLLGFPATVSAVFLSTPFLVYLTPWFEAAMRSDFQNELLRFTLVGVGYYYYWMRLRVDPVPHEYPHMVSVWITFAEAVTDGALGIILMWGSYTVALDYYTALARPWGMSFHQDQLIGGGAIWVVGDLAGLPFIGALWRRMFREDKHEAAAVDTLLDALEIVEHADAAQNPGEEALPEGHLRPWWETDPRFAHRFGASSPENGAS